MLLLLIAVAIHRAVIHYILENCYLQLCTWLWLIVVLLSILIDHGFVDVSCVVDHGFVGVCFVVDHRVLFMALLMYIFVDSSCY